MKTVALVVTLLLPTLAAADEAAMPAQVFKKRIMPIFKSPNPSSCVQCHLAGVDLKDYLRPTHEATFRSLRDQGLIDLNKPEESKILRLIDMGAEESAGASLIQKKTRDAERAAFAEWIKASVADRTLVESSKLPAAELSGPKRPVEVVRNARTDRVLASFENTVWALRFRCMGCHVEGSPENKKLVEEHGERVSWLKAAGPAATLASLRDSRLIDLKNPRKSLLLTKPLNTVKHVGGQKFVPGDQGDLAFRRFLDDYAATVTDKYPTAQALPKRGPEPERFGSNIWLKLTATPASWGDKLLQADLYSWDNATKKWAVEPSATSDRAVWGKGQQWQQVLTLLAPKGSEQAGGWKKGPAALPAGKYLVKILVDKSGPPKGVPSMKVVGTVEVESKWPEGYDRITAVDASRVRPAAK